MILCGDSLEVLKTLEANSVDSVVTDPPYGISFMSRHWDYDVPQVELWREVYRVLKPGGHLLSFAGTRTQHRMAVNIEDAGFEIRDMIAWVYGSGFPKSLNIGKAVDKLQGNEREVVREKETKDFSHHKGSMMSKETTENFYTQTTTITETKGTSEWEGWGTALKPAMEMITVARKPLGEKTIAQNVLKYGTGGLNIDGSRVEANSKELYRKPTEYNDISPSAGMNASKIRGSVTDDYLKGRFPANLIHDGSDEVVGLFPDTGKSTGGRIGNKGSMINTMGNNYEAGDPGFGDSGSAARYFKVCEHDNLVSDTPASCSEKTYDVVGVNGTKAQPGLYYTAKASKSERNKGLEGFEEKSTPKMDGGEFINPMTGISSKATTRQNHHPTVKPVKLMQYLVRLVTPKGGTVLDPFTGSGTTGIACKLEGMEFVGIEREQEYVDIAQARIEAWEPDKQEKLI